MASSAAISFILNDTMICRVYSYFSDSMNRSTTAMLEGHNKPEDVSFRNTIEHLSPDTILATISSVMSVDRDQFLQRRRNSPLRAIAAQYLIKYAGVTQREVAELLDAGGAIGKQIFCYAELLCRTVVNRPTIY